MLCKPTAGLAGGVSGTDGLEGGSSRAGSDAQQSFSGTQAVDALTWERGSLWLHIQ